MNKFQKIIALSAVVFAVTGCDVDKTEKGEMPSVDADGGEMPEYEVKKTEEGEMPDVDVEGGEMPEYDVDTADVDIDTEKETVEVPEVEVTTEEETVEVPEIEVDMPEDDEK